MITAALIMAFLLSLAASCFFSGTETGFLSVNRARVLHMAREGGVRAKMIEKAISDMGRTTTSILVGNNIVLVIYTMCLSFLLNEAAKGLGWESVNESSFIIETVIPTIIIIFLARIWVRSGRRIRIWRRFGIGSGFGFCVGTSAR